MTDCWARSPFRQPPQHAKFIIHLAIADVVNDVHGNKFWMLNEPLAEKAIASRSSVDRTLSELVQLGWLVVLEAGGGRGRATLYHYHLGGKPPHHDAVCGETASPDEPNRVTSDEPSTSYPNEPQSAALFDVAEIDDDFETWWSGWPVKKDKSKARRCYHARRQEGAGAAALLAARDAYLATKIDDRDFPKFVKHGATFLAKGDDAPWTEYVGAESAMPHDEPGTITQQLARQQWSR